MWYCNYLQYFNVYISFLPYYLDGPPYFYTQRPQVHTVSPICKRIECTLFEQHSSFGEKFWIPAEFVMNCIFTIEFFLRIYVSSSVLGFFKDTMNLFDFLSIAPFFAEVSNTAYNNEGSIRNINFAILSSTPSPLVLVVMRSFKVS